MPPETSSSIRVFLSYSHDSREHAAKVLALADKLREDGLDVALDQYVRDPQEGWPRWMRRQIMEARWTITICTATYRQRYEGGGPPDVGRGVDWEGLLLSQTLYEAKSVNRSIVPARFSGAHADDIPMELRPYTTYVLPDSYDELYAHLTDQKPKPPALGAIRVLKIK